MSAGPGQPPIFNNPDDLEKKVEEYFEHIKGEALSAEPGFPVVWKRSPEPCTITGLCLYLGFESRQSFYDYEKRDGFSYTIKKARMRVENEYEKNLQWAKNPAGSIFALKNMGWADKLEVEKTVKRLTFKDAE